MSLPARMRFGIFLAPFHPLGENPTLSLERDLELLQWLDTLGFDEAWIGEHHSAGWETIASPELFIATAAERTRHIKLGTGVISLPYHHPLMVANRMVLLDHLTRGRVMLGVGPGALVSDAYMLGIEPTRQREMMDESLGIIIRLFTETEPITYTSDWFKLNEAMLHLRPYQRPYMPIAVAATQSPAGMVAAGKHGAAVLSISVAMGVSGPVSLRNQWQIAEETAAKAGKTMSRDEWRLVMPVYLAESREEALKDARLGAGRFQREYFGETLGQTVAMDTPLEGVIDKMVESSAWVVGTPDDCIARIEQLDELSGGYGGLLILAHEWAPREKILKSYELFARYVMPRFQSTLTGVAWSNRWSREHKAELQAMRTQSIEKATQAYAESKRGAR
ncbi:MAG: LLM class flavin-dependent oxidoreductase [Candidatus Tectomicrobia bacterium]|nr:LLM class flavin-dependent oxidoreductase [Candidatus Tectomicrobia bacterium]